MAKKRVHEIAKEKGISSKEVLAVLQGAGIDVKAAASSVDEAEIERAFAANGGGDAAKASAATVKDPAKEAPEQAAPKPKPKPKAKADAAAPAQKPAAPRRPPPPYAVGRARPERAAARAGRGAADADPFGGHRRRDRRVARALVG